MTSDAQKKATRKWQKKTATILSVRIQHPEADAFRAACAAAGVTPHSVFLAAARGMIAAYASGVGAGGDTGGADSSSVGGGASVAVTVPAWGAAASAAAPIVPASVPFRRTGGGGADPDSVQPSTGRGE